jgi:hypothetical protein
MVAPAVLLAFPQSLAPATSSVYMCALQLPAFEQKLDDRITEFDTSGRGLISLVLELAYEHQLPAGIEYVDEAAFRPLRLVFRNESVREILMAMVVQVPEYRISFSRGVVDIYSPRARDNHQNLLNAVISDFAVDNVDTHKADLELFCILAREFARSGCAFSVAFGQWGTRKITLHMRNATVYEILNEIVAENGSAVWTVIAPQEKLDQIPVGGLWHVYPLDLAFKEAVFNKLETLDAPRSQEAP